MELIYFNLIAHDPPLWTLERVPAKWRNAVRALLEEANIEIEQCKHTNLMPHKDTKTI